MTRKAEDKLEAPPDFKGPTEDRGCTDILFTLLLLASWAAMTYLGVISIQRGDYRLVVNPMDYDGNVCGTDYGGKDMKDYPNLYLVNFLGSGVCVKECPSLIPSTVVETLNTTAAIETNNTEEALGNDNVTIAEETNVTEQIEDPFQYFAPYTLVTYGGVFQLDGYTDLDADSYIQVADYSDSNITCTADSCFPDNDPVKAYTSLSGINQGYGNSFYLLDTTSILGRCLPNLESLEAIQNVTGTIALDPVQLDQASFFERFYGDCWTARNWILGFGFCVALVMSFIYITFLRIQCVLEIMVWGSILLTNALIFGGGAYLFLAADAWALEDPQVYSDADIRNAKIVSYVLFAFGALFFLLMIYLRKEIQLALGTVEETSKAVNKMPILSLYPVLECLGLVAFLGVWMVYAVYLASVGSLTTQVIGNPLNDVTITLKSFEYDDIVIQSAWYLLFCLFWSYQFIISMGEIIVAMSVAKWYFTRDKSKIGNTTVITSIITSFFYHTGTAAFGSLILAIVRIIRTVVAKIQKEAKAADNKLAEILLCSCACCMWCLDNFLRFMNKNAFIQTAIFGTSFCRSATEAFYLIARNAAKIGAITYVSEAVSIVGKLFITAGTGVASYFAIDYFIGEELSSVAGPTVLVLILAYNVADAFLDIFEIGVSTILQCFVADDEMFTEEESFAGGDLKHFIDDWDK